MKQHRRTADAQRARTGRILACLCAAVLTGMGCASKWELHTDVPASPLEWRDYAGTARVSHLMTVRGFKETAPSAKTFLKYAIFGKSKGNNIIRPVAVATGADERLAVADMGCTCVHLYIPADQRYIKIFGTKTKPFRSPVSVAFDRDGRLYVSDSVAGEVTVFDGNGSFLKSITNAGTEQLKRPTGLSYSQTKNILYAIDTQAHSIHAFDTTGKLLFSFGERGKTHGKFNFPTHITVSAAGNVYVTDAMNFRVQVFDHRGAFIASLGKHGNGSGDFAMPKGIAVDNAGVIYVVDTLFDNIQMFNIDGGFLLTVGGRGAGDAQFWLPSGLFLDNRNNLYVCDTFNQRIQIFQIRGSVHE